MTSLTGRHVATGSCVILMQASQEQNFEDEGGKRVVIGTGYVQANRRASDWSWLGNATGNARGKTRQKIKT